MKLTKTDKEIIKNRVSERVSEPLRWSNDRLLIKKKPSYTDIKHEVKCKSCGLILARHAVAVGENGINDGLTDFSYTQHLLAYRLREDGLFGLECICGYGDTRLSTDEKEKYPHKFPSHIKTTNKEEADFGKQGEHFSCYKLLK